jgi:hypothetical protein
VFVQPRWGAYALYDGVDEDRYQLVVDLFAVLSVLCTDGQSRNQLRQLWTRALDMLMRFEQIGPLQDHTAMAHLIIELIKQALRWGPPSSYWCYFLERMMGYLIRGIKSKRHAEANIMSRYRKSLVPGDVFDHPALNSLGDALTPCPARPADKFPTRSRDGMYTIQDSDYEDLHEMFSGLSQTYRRVAREFVFCHGQEPSVGIGLQAWKPWLAPVYNGSGTWLNRNNVSLAEALRAFQVRKINIINSGVFHGGERRTGSKATDATSAHTHAYSIFTFKHGPLLGQIGKILFMFKMTLPTFCHQVMLMAR